MALGRRRPTAPALHRLAVALAAVLVLAACGSQPSAVPTRSPIAPLSPSPSAPAARPLIALWTLGYPSARPEIRIVGLDGTTVASLELPLGTSPDFTAGGDRVLYFGAERHLQAFRADGRVTDLGILHAPSYPATTGRSMLTARVGDVLLSPDGKQMAWATSLAGPPGRWQPMSYIDFFITNGEGRPVQVRHELAEASPVLYRWTARGPLFFLHPIADLPTPFPQVFPPLYLADRETYAAGTVWDQPDTCRVDDVAANGTTACIQRVGGAVPDTSRASVVFRQGAVQSSVDLGAGVTGMSVQFGPGLEPGEAVIGVAHGQYPTWTYESRVVDIETGGVRAAFANMRPGAVAWMVDGSLLLEGTGDSGGVFVVAPGAQPRLLVAGHYRVIAPITG